MKRAGRKGRCNKRVLCAHYASYAYSASMLLLLAGIASSQRQKRAARAAAPWMLAQLSAHARTHAHSFVLRSRDRASSFLSSVWNPRYQATTTTTTSSGKHILAHPHAHSSPKRYFTFILDWIFKRRVSLNRFSRFMHRTATACRTRSHIDLPMRLHVAT